jgi:hypothetical protein
LKHLTPVVMVVVVVVVVVVMAGMFVSAGGQ